MTETETYIPGVCNIGPGERLKRRNAAIAASLFLLLATAALVFFVHSIYWRIALFPFAAAAGLTVQQWYQRFCYGFAMAGIFRMNDSKNAERIAQDDYLRLDRLKAQRMLFFSLLFGVIYTSLCLLIPSL